MNVMVSGDTGCAASKKRVFLVDDHPLVRMGVTEMINAEPDLVVCGEAEDESQALAAIETLKPDVAVVDWSLKDKDASELIAALCRRRPRLPVLVLSVHEEELYGAQAMSNGACAYIMKHEATGKLVCAIRRAISR